MNKLVIWQIIWLISGPLGCIVQVGFTMIFGLVSLKTIHGWLRESVVEKIGEIPENYMTALLIFEWALRMYVPLYSWIMFIKQIRGIIRRLKNNKKEPSS